MEKLIKKNLPELIRIATAITGNKTIGEDLVHNAIEKILIKYPLLSHLKYRPLSRACRRRLYSLNSPKYIQILHKKSRACKTRP